MTHGSLFNGIGGFQLAARWMRWENIFHCEIDEFCNKVVKKHFPKSIQHGDIRETDFTKYRGAIDVLSGGFPCQPFSNAGKRQGTADDRHLWPEMLRAIRAIQSRWVVGENVRGLTNWNGGMVFDQVQADLEAEGYEVLPFLLPACAVNAPHRRDRIWFIAYAEGGHRDLPGRSIFGEKEMDLNGNGAPGTTADSFGNGYCDKPGKNRCEEKEIKGAQQREERNKVQRERDGSNAERIIVEGATSNSPCFGKREQADEIIALTEKWQERVMLIGSGGRGLAPDPDLDLGPEGGMYQTESEEAERHAGSCRSWRTGNTWENFPSQSPVCGGDDGVSRKLDTDRLKALGNAIVPQVALQLFRAIEEYETESPWPNGPLDRAAGGEVF